jgi:hypothetical protein
LKGFLKEFSEFIVYDETDVCVKVFFKSGCVLLCFLGTYSGIKINGFLLTCTAALSFFLISSSPPASLSLDSSSSLYSFETAVSELLRRAKSLLSIGVSSIFKSVLSPHEDLNIWSLFLLEFLSL